MNMVLPERPEDQPRAIVTAMMRLTTLGEAFVREHLAIMGTEDASFAWERIRANERATGTRISRPEHLPNALVDEIHEFSGVLNETIRQYLAIRHVMNTIGAWERLAPATAAEARLQQWRVRLAIGRPLPPWAQALINEIGIDEDQRGLATGLVAATIALVGGGQAEVHAWLAGPDPETNRTPLEVVHEDGWPALDDLLLQGYEREHGSSAL